MNKLSKVTLFLTKTQGRNNSKMSGSQQDYLVGKSGSPPIFVVVI